MDAKEIFVVNCGSSSVKVDVFDFSNGEENHLGAAVAGRVGSDETMITIKAGVDRKIKPGRLNHGEALRYIAAELEDVGFFKAKNRFAVGHRVVHGAHFFNDAVLLNESTTKVIKDCTEFAPLHNPANLSGIRAAAELFDVPQVGVFDTAFHNMMPEKSRTYALPRELTEKYQIQRYGFHGTSHEFVGRKVADKLGRDFNDLNIISLHLGNGASACAIRQGFSVDTSMGFTPLEGLVMGTRSGDLDPAIVSMLMQRENLDPGQVDQLLNKESGLKGICGKNDMRDILAGARGGDERCRLARDVFVYRVRKYIGSYFAVLNGADAIVFTGGIGENAVEVRWLVMERLNQLGILPDLERNKEPLDGLITTDESPVPVYVIPTDEELMIARKTMAVLGE